MTDHFRKACDLWDGIAGTSDWEAFALAFDRTIEGLEAADINAVGLFLERLRLVKAAHGRTPSEVTLIDSRRRVEKA